ncbi:hypothetical protein GCM10011519_17760 [Marmoricola endophyticus]|uniref:Bacterial bifunctional deaminase-reductase C-terminal domain-containing protein n=1 Tax=Marmoricola endophyticus TaxID=2040280 RepID=A0A917F1R6_9ACTN|nr:dihydrofolate reductase family protein [Marmoricola endophyticus]GGF44327.1 hypothetical protein GCM10011519_17760 [Marmoricola endophyticus]
MGRLVSTFFSTLDGVVESPHTFHFPYFDEAMAAAMSAHQEQVTAYLMGRRLYDEWSTYWPGNTADELGAFINPLPKYVLSSSLTQPTWEHTTVLSGAPDEVAADGGA